MREKRACRTFEITTSIDADAVRTTDVEAVAIEADRASEALEKRSLEHGVRDDKHRHRGDGERRRVVGRLPLRRILYEALDTTEWSLTDDGELSLPTFMYPDENDGVSGNAPAFAATARTPTRFHAVASGEARQDD